MLFSACKGNAFSLDKEATLWNTPEDLLHSAS